MAEPRAPRPVVPIRLAPGQRRALYGALALLWSSGALWLAFHYFLQSDGRFGPEPNVLEPWWLRLHGLAVMLTLLGIGSVLPQHVRRAWELKRNRGLGATLGGVSAWLALTGYALYYFSSDANQAWLPLLHWAPGLALPIALAAHVRRGRVRRAARAESAHAEPCGPVRGRRRSTLRAHAQGARVLLDPRRR